MKSRLSPIILSVLILSLALQTITLPALAQSEPNVSQAGIEIPIILPENRLISFPDDSEAQIYPEGVFGNIPSELAEPDQRHSEIGERPEYIPPSPEIIAKTLEQVNSFNCASVTDVSQIECEALVEFYESTNGAGWGNTTNYWLRGTKVADWFGVTVTVGRGVTELNLYNNRLTGGIPAELSNLSNLGSLLLGLNRLSGSIPAEISNLSNLRTLNLIMNELTGTIPIDLDKLSNLEELSLSDNRLTGIIPVELIKLSNLEYLDLSGNQLTGSIPAELGNLSNLLYLFLYKNNLTGSIPAELSNLSNLRILNLSLNQLTGTIPTELGNLSNLQILALYRNQLTGSIPLSFVNLTKLHMFYFSETNLCEPTTPEFLAWKSRVGEWSGTGIICEENPTDASWLLMYYMAADNNLSDTAAKEYANIINKRQPNVDIAILYDDPDLDTSYRFIGQGGELERIEKANLNTGYGRTLTNFINWAKSKSTAQKQALVIFDHGNGLKGVAWDDRNDDDFISIDGEIRTAILDAGSVDLIWNHNCLTGNIEFMWELRGLTDYYVASESISRGPSKHNYIKDINQDTNPKELAIKIAQSYFTDYLSPKSPSTISVVDMSYINEMSQFTHELAASIRQAPKSVKDEVWSLTDYRKLQRFDLWPYGINNEDQLADLFHFASLLQNMDEFRTPASNLLNLEEDFVIFNRAWSGILTYNNKEYIWDHSNARGVSIGLPRSKKSFYNGDWIKFGTGANWDYGNYTKASVSEVEGYDWGPMISELVFLYNPDSEDQPNPPDLEPLIVDEECPIYLPIIFR